MENLVTLWVWVTTHQVQAAGLLGITLFLIGTSVGLRTLALDRLRLLVGTGRVPFSPPVVAYTTLEVKAGNKYPINVWRKDQFPIIVRKVNAELAVFEVLLPEDPLSQGRCRHGWTHEIPRVVRRDEIILHGSALSAALAWERKIVPDKDEIEDSPPEIG